MLSSLKLISYISSYKADDATGEVLPESSSLMKAANLCFASGMFKMDEVKEKWGGTCCAEGSKAPGMPDSPENSKHSVHEHLFRILWLLRQQGNCCSKK